MKVAVTDYSFPDLELERSILEPLGHQVMAWKEKRPPAELGQLVADADAVIVQFAACDASVVAAMRQARVIVRYGIGYDNVDLEAARQRRIPVVNVPDYCIDEVADHTLALILESTRRVVANAVHVRAGHWGLAVPLPAMRTLVNMTVGIIGLGRIGREVLARLRPFKCRILVHDPFVDEAACAELGGTWASLEELLRQSDLVTLHCPSTAATRGLIDREKIAMLRPGSILINVGRGDLVDPQALTEAIVSGHLAATGLDVFSPEPVPADHPLRSHPDAVIHSHIASASVPAVQRLRETAANLAADALAGRPLRNVVNGVPTGDSGA